MSPVFGRRSGTDPAPRDEPPTRPAPGPPATPGTVTPTAAETSGAEGLVLASRYRLGPMIGRGGKASVHSARDLLLRRDVAVKVFRARAVDEDELRVQEAEARMIASMNHYALTTLFDAGVEGAGTDEPQLYLVMEHVGGGDLRSRLRTRPLDVTEASWLGFDLSEALDYVHQSGFLHRDIKPANVLLSTLRSAKPIVGKLADFGIASLVGQPDLSEFTSGTAAYLSPEQVEGLDAVPASDVYSLGLVLLEAITGRVEFPGTVEQSAFARLRRDPRIPDHLPPKVAEVLRGMTALEPDARMPLEQAALQLQQHLVDVLVQSRVPDPVRPAVVGGGGAGGGGDGLVRGGAAHGLGAAGGPDAAFDAVTRIAARVLDVPISMLALVEPDAVRLASVHGWDPQHLDRDVALHVVADPGDGRPWAVPDALADPRTQQDPHVLGEPRIRALAGVPLVGRDGRDLGVLCVLDRRPRDFTAQQLETLADLAGLALHELELRSATRRALFE